MITDPKIGIIGGGNMGKFIATGLVKNITPGNIFIVDRNIQKCAELEKSININAATSWYKQEQLDILIIAIKPQQISSCKSDIENMLSSHTIILSIAAGVSSKELKKFFGLGHKIIRAMPTTAAKYNLSATAIYSSSSLDHKCKALIEIITNSIGSSTWLDNEKDLDIATAIAGSGIAYYFTIMQHIVEHAKELGLREDKAKQLTCFAVLGAGTMALKEENSISDLIKQVTSPKGVTIEALNSLNNSDIKTILQNTINSAIKRINELGG